MQYVRILFDKFYKTAPFGVATETNTNYDYDIHFKDFTKVNEQILVESAVSTTSKRLGNLWYAIIPFSEMNSYIEAEQFVMRI